MTVLFDGPWYRWMTDDLGVPVDSEAIADVRLVVEQWQWRCKSEPVAPRHLTRQYWQAALGHFLKMQQSIALARGRSTWDVITPRLLYGNIAPPSIAVTSLDAYLRFHADLIHPLRVKNAPDALLAQQLAIIWRRAGKYVPKSLDKELGPFGRFVMHAAGRELSRKATDRALRHLHLHADINE